MDVAGTLGKESIVLVEFELKDGGTQLTLTHRGLPDEKNREEHRGGWAELLEWLEDRGVRQPAMRSRRTRARPTMCAGVSGTMAFA